MHELSGGTWLHAPLPAANGLTKHVHSDDFYVNMLIGHITEALRLRDPQPSSGSLVIIRSHVCIMGSSKPGYIDEISTQPLWSNELQISAGGEYHCIPDAGYKVYLKLYVIS